MSRDTQSDGSQSNSIAFAFYCGTTILLGAFLLFQVQPVISKMILPWFGGTPAVWSTCMLFFQVFLLGGYAYAHFINHVKDQKTLRIVHITLIVIAVCLSPIIPSEYWKPTDGSNPAVNILMLLTVKVGLPYLLLATTAPLVQTWFGRVYPNMSPYRLYALSNFGSLSALLTYPIFFERTFTTFWQGWMWSVGFMVYGCLIVLLLLRLPTKKKADSLSEKTNATLDSGKSRLRELDFVDQLKQLRSNPQSLTQWQDRPKIGHYFLWILLPALASVMLLVVTHHISEDVAVAPFMWIVPLSLYLITFIICFDHERWYLRRTFAGLAIVSVLAVTHGEKFMEKRLEAKAKAITKTLDEDTAKYKLNPVGGGILDDATARRDLREKDPQFSALEERKKELNDWKEFFDDNVWVEAVVYFAALFFVCMICHGELVRRKPPVKYLTSFYLSVSAGGALGGVFVALICPIIYSTYMELAWGFILSYWLAVLVFAFVCISNWVQWLVPSESAREEITLRERDNKIGTLEALKTMGNSVQFIVAAYFFWTFWNVDEISGMVNLAFFAILTLIVTRLIRMFIEVGGLRFPRNFNRILNHPTFVTCIRLVAIASHIMIAGVAVGLGYQVYKAEIKLVKFKAVHKARNFYGVLSVREEDEGSIHHRRQLYHGTIIHGSQLRDDTRNMEPNSYYRENSGVGLALLNFPNRENLHVGVIGLGTGTLCVYGRKGDRYRYYEINPLVKKICLEYFSYIKRKRESGTKVDIEMGDARLTMERELTRADTKDDKMDVIVLDAFRSDAIPAHLLTKEALEIYIGRLESDGIIAIHISNRYLDLRPVVQGLADHFQWTAIEVNEEESTWVLFTNNKQFLAQPRIISMSEPVSDILNRNKPKPTEPLLWTDQFSNLLQILRWNFKEKKD